MATTVVSTVLSVRVWLDAGRSHIEYARPGLPAIVGVGNVTFGEDHAAGDFAQNFGREYGVSVVSVKFVGQHDDDALLQVTFQAAQ